jgi:hypothetical protein
MVPKAGPPVAHETLNGGCRLPAGRAKLRKDWGYFCEGCRRLAGAVVNALISKGFHPPQMLPIVFSRARG